MPKPNRLFVHFSAAIRAFLHLALVYPEQVSFVLFWVLLRISGA